ncbi:uncharacterized protein [Physcomitrium patens]|uniref:RNA-binding S4 domain-containing protein n=1 Tax=Physcomitrium patens TaxID=3218 RepID=A0A2K1J2G8_PHYPA|nr:hypothetical protein PHYPA_021574 [Physcomitrium patens]
MVSSKIHNELSWFLNLSRLPQLETLVFEPGMAKSIHHARVLIKQRHIMVGKQIVDVPSFRFALTVKSTLTLLCQAHLVAEDLAEKPRT